MIHNKLCAYCGAPFQTGHLGNKFCCRDHAKLRLRQQQREHATRQRKQTEQRRTMSQFTLSHELSHFYFDRHNGTKNKRLADRFRTFS